MKSIISKLIKGEMVMKKSGIIMADLHFGASNNVDFNNELKLTLFDYISKLPKLDFCIIAGDLFDSIEYLSSDTTRSVIRFIATLLESTKKFNTEIRILEGTRTHDNKQLKTLEDIFNDCLCVDRHRISFIHTVTDDILCGELKVLYLPEEYVVDDKIYYNDYFTNRYYDFIFGHGTINKVSFVKHIKSSMTAPVFNVQNLTAICNYCYFGHIHKKSEYCDNRFKYVGPMTRWTFDQTGPCGFYYIDYDRDNNRFYEEYIENIHAPIYVTKIYDIDNTNNSDILSIWKYIYDDIYYIKSNTSVNCKIRIIVNIESSVNNISAIKDLLTLNTQNYNDIKLIINTVDSGMSDVHNENTECRIVETYNNCPDEVKIQQFIKNKTGRHRTIDDIRRHLCITEEYK